MGERSGWRARSARALPSALAYLRDHPCQVNSEHIFLFVEGIMTESVDVTQFTRVDDTRDTSFFVQFLDARTGIEGERQVKELEIAMLAVERGACVLDIGCGTGDDAREIARLVGPNGEAVGLDSSGAMVVEGRKRA